MHLITGTPGAGKSYLAVSILLETYYDNEHGAYIPKKIKYDDGTEKQILIITNIDGLELEHESLDEILNKIPFHEFFTVEYQEKIQKKYHDKKIVYVIDEAQRFIGRRFRDDKCIFYFDYHRHFDHDVYLITQDIWKLCKDISALHEFEFRAVKASFQAFGMFQYIIKSNGEPSGRKTVRKKKEIFGLYKSFQVPGAKHNITKNRILLYSLIGFISMFFLWKMTFASLTGGSQHHTTAGPDQLNAVQSSTRLQSPPSSPVVESGLERPEIKKFIRQQKVKVRDVAAIYNADGSLQRLIYFRCPVTNEMKRPNEIPYQLNSVGKDVYAILQPDHYESVYAAYRSESKDIPSRQKETSSFFGGSKRQNERNHTREFLP